MKLSFHNFILPFPNFINFRLIILLTFISQFHFLDILIDGIFNIKHFLRLDDIYLIELSLHKTLMATGRADRI